MRGLSISVPTKKKSLETYLMILVYIYIRMCVSVLTHIYVNIFRKAYIYLRINLFPAIQLFYWLLFVLRSTDKTGGRTTQTTGDR